MKKTLNRRLCACLVCLVLFAALLPGTAYARGIVDLEKPVTLTIQYPSPDAVFRIYRVADVSRYGEYSLCGDFTGYGVSIDQPDAAGWRALAYTLASYAQRDELEPMMESKTQADGTLLFSALPGMYLVVGEKSVYDGWVYSPEPFIVALPGLDSEDNWVYDVSSQPKYEKEEEVIPEDVSVLKIWDDGKDETNRPKQIEVQLLQNGVVVDTVVLSKDNNWRYTWEGLDSKFTWTVVEKDVPDGYKVSISPDNGTIVITNKRTPPPTPDEPKLPQTGQLWWPVPILVCCGLGMFLIGWRRRQGDARDV